MSDEWKDFVAVPLNAIHQVRWFFRANRSADGYLLSFIAKSCGLQPLPAIAAVAFLIEEGDVEVRVEPNTWHWTFRAKGAGR